MQQRFRRWWRNVAGRIDVLAVAFITIFLGLVMLVSRTQCPHSLDPLYFKSWAR